MRKLRIPQNEGTSTNIEQDEIQVNRKLRANDVEIEQKVERLLALQTKFSEEEKAFKSKTTKMKSEIDNLKKELLEYGEENKLENIVAQAATVTFSSRVSRRIDPKLFLAFLNAHGRAKSFYDYVDVPLTNAIKNFGEAVLESSGAMTSTVNQYAGLKVSAAS